MERMSRLGTAADGTCWAEQPASIGLWTSRALPTHACCGPTTACLASTVRPPPTHLVQGGWGPLRRDAEHPLALCPHRPPPHPRGADAPLIPPTVVRHPHPHIIVGGVARMGAGTSQCVDISVSSICHGTALQSRLAQGRVEDEWILKCPWPKVPSDRRADDLVFLSRVFEPCFNRARSVAHNISKQ